MPRRNNKKKTRVSKRSRKPTNEHFLYSGMEKDQLIVPKRFRILPPSLVTNLVFADSVHAILNNSGATYASIRFRPSSAFDVDPTIGGTTMPGFNELAGIYGRYRCLGFKVEVIAVNLDNEPVNTVIFVSNFDLGVNYSQVQSNYGNFMNKYKLLSAKGGMDRAKLTLPYRPIQEMVGTDAAIEGDDFASAVTGSPVNNTYVNIGIWTGTNAHTLLNGVLLQTVITARYRFYEIFHLITEPDPPTQEPRVVEITKKIELLSRELGSIRA